MSEAKIAVPEGMRDAFRKAMQDGLKSGVHDCFLGLEAALRWQDDVLYHLSQPTQLRKENPLKAGIDIVRRMYLAPEPKTIEDRVTIEEGLAFFPDAMNDLRPAWDVILDGKQARTGERFREKKQAEIYRVGLIEIMKAQTQDKATPTPEAPEDLAVIADKLASNPDWRKCDLDHALLEAYRLGQKAGKS